MMHALHTVYQWVTQPGPAALDPIVIPDYSSLPILQVPAVKEYLPLQRYEVTPEKHLCVKVLPFKKLKLNNTYF